MGKIWDGNQNDKKNDEFQYFSIKSYVVDVYKNRLADSNTHPRHIILLKFYNLDKNTCPFSENYMSTEMFT